MHPDQPGAPEGRDDHLGPYFRAAEPYWEEQPWFEPAAEPTAAAAVSQHRSRRRLVVRELVETGILAVLVFLCVRATLGTYSVEGHSMDPTLGDGEFLVVSRLQYATFDAGRFLSWLPLVGDSAHHVFGPPSRGDVVVLKDPRDPNGKNLVKRIIGLPGETVEIADGRVYIDGRLLDEPYIMAKWAGSKPRIVVGAHEYFVLGDNRNNSSDSRFFGLVPEDLLEGRVIGSPWPPARVGKNFGAEPTLGANVTRP